MKKNVLVAALVVATSNVAAQTHEILLWPDGAAESNGITAPEERRDDGSVYNVSEAALYVWCAVGENTGKTVLICPGGGYGMQAAGHEGRQYAEWLAANGITAAVLKYRLPNGHADIPLKDARQAMRVLRDMAGKWNIDSAKIGVMGFSAGGHLASTLLTDSDEGTRPDFGILYYPVITMREGTHGGSRRNLLGAEPTAEAIERYSSELRVTPVTPPTTIFFSDDDTGVDPRNGTMFYDALKNNGVPATLYIFPTGGHGWGFREEFAHHDRMKDLTLEAIARF